MKITIFKEDLTLFTCETLKYYTYSYIVITSYTPDPVFYWIMLSLMMDDTASGKSSLRCMTILDLDT